MFSIARMTSSTTLAIIFFMGLGLMQTADGMTHYEYFVPGGTVEAALVADGDSFTLNNKEIVIYSGSFHYFRVHPEQWRDRLKKFRAAGLNAVQIYVPWNLHEPRQGVFDFGDLDEDMSPFLDIHSFIQMAQEEDLFVIFRPGPYICAEWEFGGMPSWLLRDENMQVRTDYDGFLNPVRNYFNNLLPRVADLQFTRGGPIISIQIENEFGSFGDGHETPAKNYLETIRDAFTANGFNESLHFTSDGILWSGDKGAVEGALMTANFNNDVAGNLLRLKTLQPNRPLMATEFWSGWFDHWLADTHAVTDPEEFGRTLEKILEYNSSVNVYMFIGGTTFGFMAGANVGGSWPFYTPDTTSYDYDAPLTEAGDYGMKYSSVVSIIERHNPLTGIVDRPEQPELKPKEAYPKVEINEVLDFPSLLSQQSSISTNEGPMTMEQLPVNDNNGQSYGYIVYQTHVVLNPDSKLLVKGYIKDMAQVLVDGTVVTKPYSDPEDINSFGFWNGKDQELTLPGTGKVAEVTIMVENLGRVNYGSSSDFQQRKGIPKGQVFIDEVRIDEWNIYAMELKGKQVANFTGWEPSSIVPLERPAMHRGSLEILSTKRDTFLDMRDWNKGVVFVNGFNVGRYWKVGPQRTLYVPEPLLKIGANEIIVFEQYSPGSGISFIDAPILGEFKQRQHKELYSVTV